MVASGKPNSGLIDKSLNLSRLISFLHALQMSSSPNMLEIIFIFIAEVYNFQRFSPKVYESA
jgi:hypothetical protein